MMKKALLAFAVFFCVTLTAVEKLNLSFTGPSTINIAGKDIAINGTFKDGQYLAIGADGVSIPAASLVGKNKGSIFFAFKVAEMLPPLNIQRALLSLRTGSRFTAGFNYFGDKSLQFSFSDRQKGFHLPLPEKIVFNKEYHVGCTWDGTVVRIYLDGKMIIEKAQPLPVPDKVRNLNIGPYKDSWVAPKKWANDTFVKYVRVYDTALSPEEVAKIFNIKFVDLDVSDPQVLTIPRIPAKMAPPVNDGKLNEPVWSFGASMPRLRNINFPEKSGEIPPNNFKILYDDKAIYLGFTSIFPGNAPIQEGTLRTDSDEPPVWANESFEFYFRQGDKTFHFAGNVAGGYMERRNRKLEWNGKWNYKTTKEVKIDSSVLWQGEVEIPWSTLELDGPPSTPVEINFCRSWKLPECGALTSLLKYPNYAMEKEPMLKTVFKSEAAIQIIEQNDPNTGDYNHKYLISSVTGGKVTYDLALGRLDGSAVPMSIFNRSYHMRPGRTIQDSQNVKINTMGYDCLVYTLSTPAGVAMREILPFKLNEEYFAATPFFLQNRIQVQLRQQMLKNKLGADFSGKIVLAAPDGKVLSTSATDKEDFLVPFDKDKYAPGEYSLELRSADGKTLSSIKLNYPGIGDWARQNFTPERIIYPFREIEYKQGDASLEAKPVCRTYSWNKSFLPVQITSLEENLFAEPAKILVDGKEAGADAFTVATAKPHRADFSAKGGQFSMSSWLEYDGVQWNELTVTEGEKKGSLDLQFTFPASIAKYLHATYCHGWGSKITRAIPDGKLELSWMPIVWIGNEEKGFCFFAEERNSWNSLRNRTYTLEKKDGKVTFTVHVWKNITAGTAKFGILATPVKKIHEQPFDIFGWDYTTQLHRQGKRPVTSIVFIKSIPSGDLGSFFGDMDSPAGHKTRKSHETMLKHIRKQKDIRPMAYTAARYLSVKYPEVAAYLPEWVKKPEVAMDYERTGHFVFECCPTTMANDFFVWKTKEMLKANPGMKGVYFDFGTVDECSNKEHGCNNIIPILAYREYFRRIALIQVELGIEKPAIVVHNTDYVMVPCYTFVTNLLNGEQIRQASSSILHNRKDIIDSMPLELFATELSSMPFGITNSVYLPFDKLAAQYGGNEDYAPYKFRMGKAAFAMTLPHNTIPAQLRNHYGLFDKLVRIYDNFGVDKAKFTGYWRNMTTVKGGDDILVSCFVLPDKVLAVIGHAGKPHKNQDFSITFNWKGLGVSKPLTKATDMMTAPDPEYDWLIEQSKKMRIHPSRAPLELGDFGSKVLGFDGNTLKMHLDFHSFAIVEIR